MKIGVISDTHGLLRDVVFSLFRGVDLIVHAGDIGSMDVITRLRSIAKTVAVLGNTDSDHQLVQELKDSELVHLDGKALYVLHNINGINVDLSGIDIIVHGHTHRPEINQQGRVLYFNPGSAGPKRPRLPVSVGIIEIKNGYVSPWLIDIER